MKGDATRGEAVFNDTQLSTNGLSCNSCHTAGAAYKASFAQPYPHPVQMAMDHYGMTQIYLDEMVQLCMVRPMAAQPLDWKSRELADLVAYVSMVQKGYKPNPCAAKNPCAANPGAARNPCAAKNPCAARNPCAAKSPCKAS